MNIHHYIGFDVHKKSISYCVKAPDGKILEEGKLRATHRVLREWAQKRTEPWHGAMEATLFSSWIYDALKPFAAELQMGNPSMMKAIGAAKKKNDRLDARKIADLVRCNLLPVCYVAPPEMRDLRRLLRYRNLVVGQAVQMKNRMSGLLMEVGAEYSKPRLHGARVFQRVAGPIGRSAGIGEGSVAAEPGGAGDVRRDAAAIARPIAERAVAGETSEAAEEHWRGGRGDGADLGAGGLRSAAVPLDRGCGELLRADLGTGVLGGQTATGADLQATQRAFADSADRGGETGAAMERAVGRAPRDGN